MVYSTTPFTPVDIKREQEIRFTSVIESIQLILTRLIVKILLIYRRTCDSWITVAVPQLTKTTFAYWMKDFWSYHFKAFKGNWPVRLCEFNTRRNAGLLKLEGVGKFKGAPKFEVMSKA